MNKILLLSLGFIASGLVSIAQCAPDAHDWGTAAYGVSPNPANGESFLPATLGISFADVVYVKCPSDAGDVNPLFTGIPIDSVRMDSITIFNGLNDVQLSAIGLEVTCNNLNDSPDPCMFMPGQSYCGDIVGVPTAAGLFDVKIYVHVFVNLAGPQEIPYTFEGYQLNVIDPNSVEEDIATTFALQQNSPNPANGFTNINYELAKSEDVTIRIMNLVGQVVYSKDIKGKKGKNSLRVETESYERGIYLYSIQSKDKKLTRKMIVQ
jgi:hypothetical protein